MTIIEFYDKASIENIAGALLCHPQQMILIGDKPKQLENVIRLYQRILAKNGVNAELSYRSIKKNNLQDIHATLLQIVESYEDCVFDLTGGEELYLVAVGMIMERYKDRVQCHRFNFRNDVLTDCDADGNVCDVRSFDISVEDNINIYGGNMVTDEQQDFYTYPWDFNSSFEHDIEVMWNICRKKPGRWNASISILGMICEYLRLPKDTLDVSFDRETMESALDDKGFRLVDPSFMDELRKRGLIRSLVMEDTISFSFKNEQVKQCLTIAGQVLELMVAKEMRAVLDKDGAPLYHDVKVGVVMDWDLDEEEACDTLNEIDVMAMKGSIPIFVSCKNGYFDMNELYKLHTVAERFGSKYARKALVSTMLADLGEKAPFIRARMADMGITGIENVDEMGDGELRKLLKTL